MVQTLNDTSTWVLVSSYKDGITTQDIESITPKVQQLIDDWHSKGRIIWSGAFNDYKTGMAIFESTKQEADEMYSKYSQICNGMLDFFMYQWDAMPILSLLSPRKS